MEAHEALDAGGKSRDLLLERTALRLQIRAVKVEVYELSDLVVQERKRLQQAIDALELGDLSKEPKATSTFPVPECAWPRRCI